MRKYSIVLVFLDLIFLLFAVMAAFNLALSVGRGRTPHRLQKDFVLLSIEWSPDVGKISDLESKLKDVRLVSAAGRSRSLPANFVQPPEANDDGVGRSALYWSSLEAGDWNLAMDRELKGAIAGFSLGTRRDDLAKTAFKSGSDFGVVQTGSDR